MVLQNTRFFALELSQWLEYFKLKLWRTFFNSETSMLPKDFTGTPMQGRFPPKYIENTFQAIQSLLDLQKCILSWAIKFVYVRSSYGSLSIFEITGASVLFSRKC